VTDVVVAGIDGGASSTTCVLVDSAGRVLGVGRGGPIDHLYTPSGRIRTRRALRDAVFSARRASSSRVRLRAVVAGLTGVEPRSDVSHTAARMIRGIARAPVVYATWDAEIAYFGASAGKPGVMVIAGTGSVAYGRNAKGHSTRAGGYGYLIDDLGGGVRIGQAALQAALRSAEGRAPATALLPMLIARLGGWPKMRRRLYGEGGGRTLLASLVPVVARAARRGDRVARGILAQAGRELGGLVVAAAARLKMLDEPFPVFPVGGVFEIGRAVLDPMRAALRTRARRAVIREPEFPPEIGAALMALEMVGITLDAGALRRLARSARRL
jgi:N-acetylglucosamine kinase-like BadF-type ATPase